MTLLQQAVDALTGIGAAMEYFTEIALVIALFAIVLKNERESVYFISALVTLFIGLGQASAHSSVSYGLLFLCAYEFMKGMEIVFEDRLNAKGWSWIKGIYNKARNRQ